MALKLARLNLVWMSVHTANSSICEVIALGYGRLLELFMGYCAAAHNESFSGLSLIQSLSLSTWFLWEQFKAGG